MTSSDTNFGHTSIITADTFRQTLDDNNFQEKHKKNAVRKGKLLFIHLTSIAAYVKTPVKTKAILYFMETDQRYNNDKLLLVQPKKRPFTIKPQSSAYILNFL